MSGLRAGRNCSNGFALRVNSKTVETVLNSKVHGTVFDLSADFNLTQTTVLTLYASGARGGGVQGFINPKGGDNPAARFIYFELAQRF